MFCYDFYFSFPFISVFRLDVFVAGIACFLIGQPTHAAPPGLTQNSYTRWQHLPSLYEENEFDVNEYVPESSITEPDMTSSDARQKRDAGKKPRLEDDSIDPCLPCHGSSEYLLKLLAENRHCGVTDQEFSGGPNFKDRSENLVFGQFYSRKLHENERN